MFKGKTLAHETLASLSSVSTDQLVLFLQISDQILGLEDELEESKWRLGSVQAVLQGEALETAFEEIGKHEVIGSTNFTVLDLKRPSVLLEG